jgi:hypothetical protein
MQASLSPNFGLNQNAIGVRIAECKRMSGALSFVESGFLAAPPGTTHLALIDA